MNPTYTRKKLDLARDDARYLAKRTGQRIYTVELEGKPGIFENIPLDSGTLRPIVAGVNPDGTPIRIKKVLKPRDTRKQFDIYSATDPPRLLGRVRTQSRTDAAREGIEQFGQPVRVALTGHESIERINQEIAREAKIKAAIELRSAKRNAREMKEMERERLAQAKAHGKKFMERYDQEQAERHQKDEANRPQPGAKLVPSPGYDDPRERPDRDE